MADSFVAVVTHLEIEQFVPERFVTDGDQVIVFGHERARVKSGGRVYTVDWVHVWTLRGGRVVAFCEYTDTAIIVAALAAAPATSASTR